jgi:hypothetical protein
MLKYVAALLKGLWADTSILADELERRGLVQAHESDLSVAGEATHARMTEVSKLGFETYEGEPEMDYLSRLSPDKITQRQGAIDMNKKLACLWNGRTPHRGSGEKEKKGCRRLC